MADNTQVAGGSGDTIRDVDRSGIKTQMMLLDVAQTGEAELYGLGESRLVIATAAGLTTASTNYTSGDQLGTELSFASIVRTARGAVVQSAVLSDKAKVMGACDLYLFSAATTPAADNAANAWSDADMLNCIGVIHFTDIIVSANNYLIQATNMVPLVVKPGSGTTIYGDLVTRSANVFFGAATDLQVTLGVIRD